MTLTSPYCPAAGFIEYRRFSITGFYHRDTMELDGWSKNYISGADVRHTFVPLAPTQFPSSYAIVITPAGTPAPANPASVDNLVNAAWSPDGTHGFIGELGTFGASWDRHPQTIFPPEPECPLVDTDYAAPLTTSHVTTLQDPVTGAVSQVAFTTKFRNLGKGPWWWKDQYPDTLRTALEERPGDAVGNVAYNYLFARGIGPVDVWWGSVNTDGTVTHDGWAWEACAHSTP